MRTLLIVIGLSLLVGCTYDPPPEARIELPESGAYQIGETIRLDFSEPIVPDSLALRVWPAGPEHRTLENQLLPGLNPQLDTCRPAVSCDGGTLTLAADGLSASLLLTDEAYADAKVPWSIEILPGLRDQAGRATKAPFWFDIQFAPPSECEGSTDIVFEDGVYVLLAIIEDPLPATLTMYNDIKVLSDGRLRWAGGKAIPIDGAPKNTADPEELQVDVDPTKGFVIFRTGCVQQDGDNAFMTTAAEDFALHIGPLEITLSDLRMAGTVGTHPETGEARIEGTISFSGVTLDSGTGDPFHYEAGNTSFFMDRIAEEQVPSEMPRLCGDLCGEIPTQCEPAEGFPGEEFCPAE